VEKFLKKNVHRIEKRDIERVVLAGIYRAFFGIDIAVDIKRMR